MGEAKKKIKRPALPPVAPLFMMVLAGWMGYAIVNTVLTFSMASEGNFLSDVVWDRFAVEFFIGFVLFPISFSFAIRTFPLYLRLPATDWSVRKLAVFFLVTSLLALIPQLPFMHTIASAKSANISAVGIILRSLAVLWLIWKLDVLTRLQMNWVQKYEVEVPGDNRRSTRPGMPDYGEFGKFELLIYAAFTWLVLGTILQIINEVLFLWQGYRYIIDDAIRHFYLLGFITNLILGMAPRMVPAFMGVKTVFRPNLVTWSFFLINFAAFARIIPKLASNVFTRFGNILYGISGLFAMASIILLWLVLFNSRKVFNREA